MAFVLFRHQRRLTARAIAARRGTGVDRPRLFALLIAVEVVRSSVSFGINTFVALYWIRHLGASSALGGAALALVLAGGVAGTLLGGRIADRIGLVRTVQLGNALLVPAFVALLLCRDPYVALPFVLLVGLVTNIPFAVLIKLGQDYLPSAPAPPRASRSGSPSAPAGCSCRCSASSPTTTARRARSSCSRRSRSSPWRSPAD